MMTSAELVARWSDGEKESVTTHTVMLGLLCMCLDAAGMSKRHILEYALVHDLVGFVAGDTDTTFALSREASLAKTAREAEALRELASAIPHLAEIARRYEEQQDPESRFVRCLDKALPKLVHACDAGRTCKAKGLTLAQVRACHREQVAEFAALMPEQTEALRVLRQACLVCERAVVLDPPLPESETSAGADGDEC